MKAIAIIEDEHRAITAVIEGLRRLLDDAATAGRPANPALLAAMFRYIERFPERLHHPKEDDFLFARLRVRRPDAAPLLDALHHEHELGRARFADLRDLHERYVADPAALPAFRDAVERYARFH
ncbi:MAG TPA: hemerythrin domain-containing protein, partial [Casimicrobiaceae bacterium]|nr:hemerythrin domain-containing protein [Casimicrobiaceae bacterium]